MKYFFFLGVLLLAVGCSGTIYTVKSPKFENYDGELITKGILHYGFKPIEKIVQFDRIRHPVTKNITHTMYRDGDSEKYCKPSMKLVMEIVVDYKELYSTYYEPGLFDSNTFGASINDGVLTSVNSSFTAIKNSAITGNVEMNLKNKKEISEGSKMGNSLPCSTYK